MPFTAEDLDAAADLGNRIVELIRSSNVNPRIGTLAFASAAAILADITEKSSIREGAHYTAEMWLETLQAVAESTLRGHRMIDALDTGHLGQQAN